MAFDEKKFVGTDALSELSTKVKTELNKKTDKAGALTNVSYDTTNKKFTKTTQGAHDPVTTDIVTTATLKNDMGIADFDGTFNSLKSKPTTISGYGITDAKVQNSTVTIGSNSVTALTQEDVSSTYDSSGTSPVDGKAVAAALGTLDVESVGGAGKYISAISETDGKISATAETMDSTPTSNSTKAVTSDGIYEYVNSSVATNTAYFIGTFDSVEELEAYSGIITNNDYAFVTSTDSSGNTLYNRYKYNGSTHTWSFEYALNNSSFTSAQWATIQSGLTSSDKTKLDGIQSGANKTIVDAAMSSSSTNPVQNKVVNTALAGKQDTLTFDSTPTQSSTNPVTSAGIYTDQARQDTLEAQDRAALIEVENKGAKNVAQTATVTFTTSKQIALSPITGNVVFSAGNITSDDTASSQCAVVFNYSDGTSSEKILLNRGNNVYYEKTLGKIATGATLYASDTTAHSSGKIATFTDIMLCTKSEWDISQTYIPYGKTNAELTNENKSQQSEINYAVNAGAKNLLKVTAKSGSSYGLTREVYDDGTITLTTGQAQNNPTLVGVSSEIVIPKGNWILSGCPSGGSDSTYRLDVRRSGTATVLAEDTGGGGTLTLSEDTTCSVFIRVAYNYSVSNLVFKPMIRSAAITDATFQPYAKTNRELTVLTDEDRESLVELVDGGGKNLLKVGAVGVSNIYGTTYENNGVTYTLNSDGTVSLSGTASEESHTNLRLSNGSVLTIDDFCNGNYVLSGCPSGGRGVFNLRARTADNAYILFDIGSGVTLTNRGAYSGIFISIFVQGGKDCTGLTFSPMICTAAAWKISQSFQPYRPSWQEMYERIVALESGGNRALTMQIQQPEEQEER